MVDFRDDVYPLMKGWLGEKREEILSVWIDEAYSAFSNKFDSREKFIIFFNNIAQPDDAERFLRLCQFYSVSKTVVKDSFTKLIMMISVIETIVMRGEKYLPFKQWIVKRSNSSIIEEKINEIHTSNLKSFRKIMEYFKDVYHKDYGSTRNVVSFFDKNLDFQDKIKIIKSFKYKKYDVVYQFSKWFYEDREKKPDIYWVNDISDLAKYRDDYSKKYRIDKDILMPSCYNWEYCYVDYGDCYLDYGCMLKKDSDLLFNYLKEIVNVIYDMRSEFVHNAHYPTIGEKGVNIVGGVYNDKSILVEMTIEDFEKIFENGFLNYYRSLFN